MTTAPPAAAPTHGSRDMPRGRGLPMSVLPLLPIFAAVTWIVVINAVAMVFLLLRTNPRNPWEAGQTVEAWRTCVGLPVYEDPVSGHATQMYGALMPHLLGIVLRVTGPNNYAGRILTLTAAGLLITLLTVVLARRTSPLTLLVAVALFFGINYRVLLSFIVNGPDVIAALLSGVSLVLMAFGHLRQYWSVFVAGVACLVLAYFVKQPSAMFAVVPALVLFSDGQLAFWKKCLFGFLPVGAMALTLCLLKVLAPAVYHYMIWVPAQYHVSFGWAFFDVIDLLVGLPLFLLAVGDWLIEGAPWFSKDRRLPWVVMAGLVAVPASSLAALKVGGAPNSLMPALFALAAFSVLRLPRLLQRMVTGLQAPYGPLVGGLFIGLSLLVTAFPQPALSTAVLTRSFPGQNDYGRTIEVVAKLEGIVVCPEDPTIPLYAKGYVGRNVYLEYDAHPAGGRWPRSTPEGVLSELRQADYVVDVGQAWSRYDLVSEANLRALGFEPAVGVADLGVYKVWHNGKERACSGDVKP
jgi:hypothetical protein